MLGQGIDGLVFAANTADITLHAGALSRGSVRHHTSGLRHCKCTSEGGGEGSRRVGRSALYFLLLGITLFGVWAFGSRLRHDN